MYFFNSIILILLLILSTYTIYKYLLKTNISKSIILTTYMFLLEGIFILLSNNLIFYIFLDFAPFLGYLIGRKKESFTLFLLTILYSSCIFNISIYYYLIYLILTSIIIFLTKTKDNKYLHLLFIKVFLTSFIYFYYNDHSSISILFLISDFIYFHVLLNLTYKFLISNNKVSKEDNMIYQVAHEVKNPIAVCKGYLDMLDINDKEKIEKYIPIIKKEMNRSLTIMDEFLELKRLSLRKELMDFSLLLDDISDTMRIVLNDKSINLDIPKMEDEVILDGDYDKLKQVIINLIKNSYEANAKNIRLSIKHFDNYLKIKVIDDGIGISDNDLKKMGETFFTTKVTGTGIGVSLSKEIIKLHDGKLSYESKINKGTTATIVLPLKYIF